MASTKQPLSAKGLLCLCLSCVLPNTSPAHTMAVGDSRDLRRPGAQVLQGCPGMPVGKRHFAPHPRPQG